MRPSGVRKPILFASNSVKRTPIPAAMTDVGPLFAVGIGKERTAAFDATAGALAARRRRPEHASRGSDLIGDRREYQGDPPLPPKSESQD
jgi:uncharacterized protein YbjT (DUF2867 family)